MNTGLIIKQLRESERILQEDLAAEISISRVYLSQLETGKKQGSLQVLRAIAEFFGVPLTLLLAWDNLDDEGEIYSKLKRLYAQLLDAKTKGASE